MSPAKWILFAVGTAAIVSYAVWWYQSREEPVRGRSLAAGLRATALTLAWLILLNPAVPVSDTDGGRPPVAFLDASYSMSRPIETSGVSAWDVALDSLASYGSVWLFGEEVPQITSTDSLPAEPFFGESRLVPVVRAADAAGAGRAIVFSDGALTDVELAIEEARRRSLSLTLINLEADYPDLGIERVDATRWIQAGDTVSVRVEIVAAGALEDSVRIEVLDDNGRLQTATWAAVPAADRFTPVRLRFPVNGRAGHRRYTVRLAPEVADLERRNDERSFYVRVTEQPSAPVLISLRPDWEPSFLLPNLDRLSDAPTAAYLWLSDSLVSLDGFRRVALPSVQRQGRAAPLLVLHGYGADAPAWARSLAASASRLLVIPAGARGFDLPEWGVRVSPPAAGEWYASPEVPASPLALDLSAPAAGELPPLLAQRTVEATPSWAPLLVQRLRRGEPVPAISAGQAGSRRWAVAAAEGYWRWGFRSGAGRQLYRSLWTGLGGWLIAGLTRSDIGLDPDRHIVERGEPIYWRAPSGADSLSVELLDADSGTVWSGKALAGDSLVATPQPGRYRYVARAYRGDRVAATAEGPAEVEIFSPELLPIGRTPTAWSQAADIGTADADARGHRQLAGLGWPYLVLIAVFCAEWAVRRFSGLR